jgi:membrane protein DedA with SNARE-associated domain
VHLINSDALSYLLSTYGYAAIFVVVMGESAGIPLPGETILIASAVLASTHKGLDIRFVILAAALAAILGDNIGFWVGRRYGEGILTRYGPKVGIDQRKQKLGRYLFRRFGGAIVFFGRFVAMLRAYAALLAGVNDLAPMTFFAYNAAGGIVWASLFGVGGYLLGAGISRVAGPVGWAALAVALVGAVFLWRFYKKHGDRLLDEAEAQMRRDGEAG